MNSPLQEAQSEVQEFLSGETESAFDRIIREQKANKPSKQPIPAPGSAAPPVQPVSGTSEGGSVFQRIIDEQRAGQAAILETPDGGIAVSKFPTATGSSKDLKNFATAFGFRSGKLIATKGHNVGSKHYKGLALDVDVKGKSAKEVEDFMAAARAAGIRVLDERTRPKGQKVWTGAHLHLEISPGQSSLVMPEFSTKLNIGGKEQEFRGTTKEEVSKRATGAFLSDRKARVEKEKQLQGLHDEYTRRRNVAISRFDHAEIAKTTKAIADVEAKQKKVWEGYTEPDEFAPALQEEARRRNAPVVVAPKGSNIGAAAEARQEIAGQQAVINKLKKELLGGGGDAGSERRAEAAAAIKRKEARIRELQKVVTKPTGSFAALAAPLPRLNESTLPQWHRRLLDLRESIHGVEAEVRKREKKGLDATALRNKAVELREINRNILKAAPGGIADLMDDPNFGYYGKRARELAQAEAEDQKLREAKWDKMPWLAKQANILSSGIWSGLSGAVGSAEMLGQSIADFDPRQPRAKEVERPDWTKVGGNPIAKDIQAYAEKINKPTDLTFAEKVVHGIGTSIPPAAIGLVTGGASLAAGATAKTAFWLNAAAGGGSEALMNAGFTYQEGRDMGFSEKEARDRAWRGFALEVVPNVLINRLQIDPKGFIGVVKRMGLEGSEELTQDIIQGVVLDRPLTVGQGLETFAIGSIIGGALTLPDSLQRKYAEIDRNKDLNPEQKREMKAAVMDQLRGGLEAKIEALREQSMIDPEDIGIEGGHLVPGSIKVKQEIHEDETGAWNQWGDPVEWDESLGIWHLQAPSLSVVEPSGKTKKAPRIIEDSPAVIDAPAPVAPAVLQIRQYKSPMLRQYADVTERYPGTVILMRVGDFYEAYGDHAKTLADTLKVTLTSREDGDNRVPMSGVPYHSVERHLASLVTAGYRVALVDPTGKKGADGLFERDVTRVEGSPAPESAIAPPIELETARVATDELYAPSKPKGKKSEIHVGWKIKRGEYSLPNSQVTGKDLVGSTAGFNGRNPALPGKLWNRSPMETTISLLKNGWQVKTVGKREVLAKGDQTWAFENDDTGGARKFAKWFTDQVSALPSKTENPQAYSAKINELAAVLSDVEATAAAFRADHEKGTKKRSPKKTKAVTDLKKGMNRNRERGAAFNPFAGKEAKALTLADDITAAKTMWDIVASPDMVPLIQAVQREFPNAPAEVANEIYKIARTLPALSKIGKRDVALVLREAIRRGNLTFSDNPKEHAKIAKQWDKYFSRSLPQRATLPVEQTAPVAAVAKPRGKAAKAFDQMAEKEGLAQVRNEEALQEAAKISGEKPEEAKKQVDFTDEKAFAEAQKIYTPSKAKQIIDKALNRGDALTAVEDQVVLIRAVSATKQSIEVKKELVTLEAKLKKDPSEENQKQFVALTETVADLEREAYSAYVARAFSGSTASAVLRGHKLFYDPSVRRHEHIGAIMRYVTWQGNRLNAKETEEVVNRITNAATDVQILEEIRDEMMAADGIQEYEQALERWGVLKDKFSEAAEGSVKERLAEARAETKAYYSTPRKRHQERIDTIREELRASVESIDKAGRKARPKKKKGGALIIPPEIAKLVVRMKADAQIDIATVKFLGDIANHFVSKKAFRVLSRQIRLEIENGVESFADVVVAVASKDGKLIPERVKDVIATLAGRVVVSPAKDPSDETLRLKLMQVTAKRLALVADAREGIFPEPKDTQKWRDLETRTAYLDWQLSKAKRSLRMAEAILAMQEELDLKSRVENIDEADGNLRVLGEELRKLKFIKKARTRVEALETRIKELKAQDPKKWDPDKDLIPDEVENSPWPLDPDTEIAGKKLADVEEEFFDAKRIADGKDKLQEYRDKIEYVSKQILDKSVQEVKIPEEKAKKKKSDELKAIEKQIRTAKSHYAKIIAGYQKRYIGSYIEEVARTLYLARPVSMAMDALSNTFMAIEGPVDRLVMSVTKDLPVRLFQRIVLKTASDTVKVSSVHRFTAVMENYPGRLKKEFEALMAGTNYNHETRYEDIMYTNKVIRFRGASDLPARDYHRSTFMFDYSMHRANKGFKNLSGKERRDAVIAHAEEIFDQLINDKESGPLTEEELTDAIVQADDWGRFNTFNLSNVYSNIVDTLRAKFDPQNVLPGNEAPQAEFVRHAASIPVAAFGTLFRFSRVLGNLAYVKAQYLIPGLAHTVAAGKGGWSVLKSWAIANDKAFKETGSRLPVMDAMKEAASNIPLIEQRVIQRMFVRGLVGWPLQALGAYLYHMKYMEPDLAEPEKGGELFYRLDMLSYGIPENMGGMMEPILFGAIAAKTRTLESMGLVTPKQADSVLTKYRFYSIFDTPFFRKAGTVDRLQTADPMKAFTKALFGEFAAVTSPGILTEIAQFQDRINDPHVYSRKKEGIFDWWKDRIPGLRQTLEPNIDKRINDYEVKAEKSVLGDILKSATPKLPKVPKITLPK